MKPFPPIRTIIGMAVLAVGCSSLFLVAATARAQGTFSAENIVDGVINDDYCFDTAIVNGVSVAVDNDGNGKANCEDPACYGALSSDGRMCVNRELDLVNGYNYCSNGIDDDQNGSADCADASCANKFGNCGPCPTREDVNYAMCADQKDADLDGLIDCADVADCLPSPGENYRRLGTLGGPGNAAFCAAAENDDVTCSDGFDNDGNGKKDCEEASCLGKNAPGGGKCENPETSCSDGIDNDADGLNDVVDPDCFNSPDWGGKTWDNFVCGQNPPYQAVPLPTLPFPYAKAPSTDFACVTTPDYSCVEVPAFLPTDPAGYPLTAPGGFSSTLSARVYGTVHESVAGGSSYNDLVELVGTSSYAAVTFVIGDATTTDRYYPYADATCVLVGSGAGQFSFAAERGKAVQVFSTGSPVGPFDLRLQCPTPSSAAFATTYPYPISVVASHADGTREDGQVETTDPLHFFSTLYEAQKPTALAVQPEGMVGPVFRVPYGTSRRLRVIPDDNPKPPTLICRCATDINSDPTVFAGPNCVSQPFVFQLSGSYDVRSYIEDAAGNTSDLQNASLDVEVTPAISPATSDQFRLVPAAFVIQVNTGSGGTQFVPQQPLTPFFRRLRMRAKATATFISGTAFGNGACQGKIYDNNGGTALLDPAGNPLTWASGDSFPLVGIGNHAICDGNLTIPDLADGEYFMTLSVIDGAGNSGESNRQVFYVCNHLPAFGEPETVCSKADFDGDGAPEALYTKMFTRDASPQVCDNCSGIYNPDQSDFDANGIGNACDADVNLGRCELDRNTPCQNDDSRKVLTGLGDSQLCDPTTDPLCCTRPSNSDLNDKQQCLQDFPLAVLDPGSPDYMSKKIRCNDCCPAIRLEPHQTAPADLGVPDSYPAKSDPQYCSYSWGMCAVGGQICLSDFECGFCSVLKSGGPVGCRNAQDCIDQGLPDTTTCSREKGIGRCDLDRTASCRTNADCGENAPCLGSCWINSSISCSSNADCPAGDSCTSVNYCDRLIPPWLQSDLGNLYSAQRIGARKYPPRGRYNATYCISAKGSISNFRGELCAQGNRTDPKYRYATPVRTQGFQTVLGKLDLNGLKNGRYGEVVTFGSSAELDTAIANGPLGGKVYRYVPVGGAPDDLTVSAATALTILNGNDTASGAGTILVEGGNLIIATDIDYQNTPSSQSNIASLASVAWIVLAEPLDPLKGGNIYIDRRVTWAVGTFFADGKSGITSVYPSNQDIYRPLTVLGVMVAKVFHFDRLFQSLEQGAERVVYDGRAVANPPPGIGDFSKALPRFGGISQ